MIQDILEVNKHNFVFIDSRLDEHERLMREGFEKKAEGLKDEIKGLEERHRREMEAIQQQTDGGGGGLFSTIGRGIDAIMSLPKLFTK